MTKREKERLLHIHRTHRRLVNWLFRTFVKILNRKIQKVERVVNLRDPDDKTKVLFGMLKEGKIFIADDLSQEEMGTTLVHELLHYIADPLPETEVLKGEEIMWQCLTKKQKKMLLAYIPSRPT